MLTTAFFLCGPLLASALPSPDYTYSIPLSRKNHLHARARTDEERIAWLISQGDRMMHKYGAKSVVKRQTASQHLTDVNVDLGYTGTVSVGTPPISYEITLDTGSSDLWLASSTCTTGCDGVTDLYNTAASSTFSDSQESITIKYGSGQVSGDIGTDTVTMSGFTVTSQPLGVITDLSTGVLSGSTSGLMGLAWQPLAQTGAPAWWETLATANKFQSPLFAFYLARFSDDPNATSDETNGGSMDIGFTNSTYYSGSIAYTSLMSSTYWLIPLDSIIIDGKTLTMGTGAAIDTGTSLIGGPTAQMATLYAQIPGAAQGTGQLSQYYIYPCSTKVDVSLVFGGVTYSINSADFSVPVQGNTCAGAFFALDIDAGNTGLEWIVGDTFMKNVYTSFRASPPSVGFATLASAYGGSGTGGSSGSATASRALPTDTGVPTGSHATATGTAASNSASPSSSSGSGSGSSSGALGTSVGAGAVMAMVGALVCGVLAVVV